MSYKPRIKFIYGKWRVSFMPENPSQIDRDRQWAATQFVTRKNVKPRKIVLGKFIPFCFYQTSGKIIKE